MHPLIYKLLNLRKSGAPLIRQVRVTMSKKTIQGNPKSEPKSNINAYLLLILFGWLGFHRLYVGSVHSGIAMIALFGFSLLAFLAKLGVAGFVALFFWCFLDIFALHKLVAKHHAGDV